MKQLLRSKLPVLNTNTLTLALHPLFIYLILIMIYISLFIYFADPILCDSGETLYDLKVDLTAETHGYRVHIINYEYLKDIHNQMTTRPMSERNYNGEIAILEGANKALRGAQESFSKITELEGRIKVIEPSFRSPLQAINYLRVGG
jgi:hypothetical protein